MKNVLTHERLLEVLAYDPATGAFTNRYTRGKARIGQDAGTIDEKGYVRIEIDQRPYRAHRLAVFYMEGKMPGEEVDHRDRDKSNNRYANLRDATHQVNSHNRIAPNRQNKTGHRGVRRSKGGRFTATITLNYKNIHLGVFDTAELAGAAYAQAKSIYHPTAP